MSTSSSTPPRREHDVPEDTLHRPVQSRRFAALSGFRGVRLRLLIGLVGLCLGGLLMVSIPACAALAYRMGAAPHEQPVSSVRSTAVLLVTATVETTPVPNSGDAADDPAIWIHPTNPSLSTIIGTDKKGGIAVYDLAGTQIQYLPDGELNNVDLRYNFPLGGQRIALVTVGNRTSNTIAIYRINSATRQLQNVAARAIIPTILIYGSTMYHSPVTGKYYIFVNDKAGVVEQWELFDNGSGLVDARMVRTFDVGSQVEGCVADDVLGYFYIAEEAVGIWKYGAEPGAGTARTQVDSSGAAGHLTSNVEGLTIYYTSSGQGYLVASSQGSSTFVVYRRQNANAYVMTFAIAAGNGIDGVSGTDGIDVTNFGLGSAFPQGVFVAQDAANDVGHQNYKLVPWQSIANADAPPLTIDTSWDPRQVGAGPVPPRYPVYLPLMIGQ
jgi:3-phytase